MSDEEVRFRRVTLSTYAFDKICRQSRLAKKEANWKKFDIFWLDVVERQVTVARSKAGRLFFINLGSLAAYFTVKKLLIYSLIKFQKLFSRLEPRASISQIFENSLDDSQLARFS